MRRHGEVEVEVEVVGHVIISIVHQGRLPRQKIRQAIWRPFNEAGPAWVCVSGLAAPSISGFS